MNRAILIRLDGTSQNVPLVDPNSNYYFDNENEAMYKQADKRYDSIMGGWWVTYVEQKPVC